MKKFIIQIVSHEDGARSEPFIADLDKFRKTLGKVDEVDQEDYILLVAEVDENEDLSIPGTPLIKVSTFMDIYQFQGSDNNDFQEVE